MADEIIRMEDIYADDIVGNINEVREARGTFESLDARLDNIDGNAPSPSASDPAMDGTASPGSADTYSRGDHVHPTDTSRQAVIDSSHKLSSDLVDDTNNTHKFATAAQLQQISTNETNISSILDGTTIDSFEDVETALSGKQATLTTAQLAAVNSGIDSTKVAQIETNKNNISSNKINIISLSCGTDNISTLGGFAIGGLNTDGSLNSSQQFRVSSTDIISFPNYEVALVLPPAFKIGYIPFVNGTAGNWSGWYNEKISIPANTILKFQIARVIDNYSEVADVGAFTKIKIVHLSSSINDISLANGTINSSGYNDYSSPYHRLLSTYVDVRNIKALVLSINNNYKYGWHTYDENFIVIDNAAKFVNNTLFLDVSNASYIRFNFGKMTDANIAPSDAASMDFKLVDISKFSDNALSYSYTGNINIGKTYTNKTYATYTPTTALPTKTPQGMSIYNGLAFLLYDKGGLAIYDLVRKSSVAEITLACAGTDNHCNSANFSTEIVSGGVYPLLYISECYGQHRCFVENITNSGSATIQTITFANENGDYTNSTYNNAFDWILDNDTGMLMTYGVMSDGRHKIKMFVKPSTSSSAVTLSESDVLDEWIVEEYIYPELSSNYIYQGNCARGGIIYLLAYQSNEIICVDENTHGITARVPLTFNTTGEPEDLAIYADTMFVMYGNKNIYGMSFN